MGNINDNSSPRLQVDRYDVAHSQLGSIEWDLAMGDWLLLVASWQKKHSSTKFTT
jgi:hypothetical protein